MEDEVGCNENLPIFQKYAFILNECKPKKVGEAVSTNVSVNPLSARPDLGLDAEPFISKIGRLMVAKVKAHGHEIAELFGPDEVLNNKKSASLIPVMYRIATESFIKESKSNFKIIECRNITKLSSDWKPSLPDLLNSLGHQVIIVELKESLNFQTYNDFVYSVLRQLNYDWKIRLPRSFFYPDDVCEVDASDDYKLLVITPKMPDGKFEFCDRVKNSLQYDILLMLKRSCESAMHNHLLMRDLRVGKFCDAVDGVESIRTVYRNLQERISSGEEVCLGQSTEDIKLYLSTSAGGLIQSAEAFLKDCKSFDDESWTKFQESEEGNELIVIKPVDSGSSVESDASSIDISTFREVIPVEEDYSVINNILSDLKILTTQEPKLEAYELSGKEQEVPA